MKLKSAEGIENGVLMFSTNDVAITGVMGDNTAAVIPSIQNIESISVKSYC